MDKISQLRSELDLEVHVSLSDEDLTRFLQARNFDVAAALTMVNAWKTWRNSTLLSSAFPDVTPSNVLSSTRVNNICNNSMYPNRFQASTIELIPHAMHGEDKLGRPIYWEKTGLISRHYNKIKKIFTTDDLLVCHLR